MEVKCSRAPGAGSTISQDKALPTGWRSEQLGPHVDIRSGESPSLFSFQTTGIPYFKVEQLNGANKYLSETPYFINVERPVAAGSIIFPKRGASILLNKIRLLRTPGYMDTNLMSLTPREAIYGEYLFYWLGHKGLAQFADVTSIPQINNKHIAPLCVQFPEDTEEQRMIAEALADADALIDSLEQLLTKKRQIKQGAMQELLTGKRRLPGFSGPWSDGVLGNVVAELVAGVSVNSDPSESSADVPSVVKTSAMKAGVFDPSECKPIIQADLARATTTLRKDTLLISRMNTPDLVGEVGYVDRNYDELFLPDRIWMTRMRSPDCVCVRWLGYLLSSAPYKQRIGDTATGTSGSMKNIAKSALLGILVSFPGVDEQQAIAQVLSDMDAEITALESRLTKARALKQAMAQALLTGRIRLVEPTA